MTWEPIQEYDHGIDVRISREHNPHIVAIFDDGERVTEPTAAIQSEDVCWEAVGYKEAKAEYCDDIDNEQDS